jgi:hypothetical protein
LQEFLWQTSLGDVYVIHALNVVTTMIAATLGGPATLLAISRFYLFLFRNQPYDFSRFGPIIRSGERVLEHFGFSRTLGNGLLLFDWPRCSAATQDAMLAALGTNTIPFTSKQLDAEREAITRALREGRQSTSSAIAIINTLWEHVRDRGPYLNEHALLFSLARSQDYDRSA